MHALKGLALPRASQTSEIAPQAHVAATLAAAPALLTHAAVIDTENAK